MTRKIEFSSEEAHAELAITLLTMITELQATLNAGETIGTVQRQAATATLNIARTELGQCRLSGGYMLYSYPLRTYPHPVLARNVAKGPEMYTHYKLIGWISDLFASLKLAEAGVKDGQQPITADQLAEGKQEVMELSSCRRPMKLY